MARDIEDRKALGSRLKAARNAVGLTLVAAATALTDEGIPAIKQTVGSWEKGVNVPDALVLKKLAKLYNQSADALLWENALSIEALQFAAEYDALNETQKRTLRAIWMAYITQGSNGDGLPMPPVHSPLKAKEPHS